MTVNDYLQLVGTPRYPLCHPGLARVWKAGEGKLIADAPLAHLLRAVHRSRPFRAGMCYSAVEEVMRNARANGWKNVLPYAGWLVIDPTSPEERPAILHHAWTVYVEGREAERGLIQPLVDPALVVDFTTTLGSFALTRDFWNGRRKEIIAAARAEGSAQAMAQAAVQWRKEWVEKTLVLDAEDIVTARVFGPVPEGYTYAGCPCDPDDARRIFRGWHAKYREDEGPGERTLSQEIEEALREGRSLDGLAERVEVPES